MKTFNYTLNQKPIESIIDFSIFKNEKNLLIQIFCGEKKDILEYILNVIAKELPQAVCIGSSTDGEINNSEITTLNTVITISVFRETTLKIVSVDEIDSFSNGVKLASLLCSEDTKLLITFTDGAKTNGEEFLNGVLVQSMTRCLYVVEWLEIMLILCKHLFLVKIKY